MVGITRSKVFFFPGKTNQLTMEMILVGDMNPTPMKSMSSSIGMMIPNIFGKIKNILNHQPVYI